MINWPKILKNSSIDWLLEKSNPSVRYFTLRDIMEKSETASEVLDSRMAIQESAVVQKILQKQDPQGFWEKADSPYLPKYKASYWALMVLGIMGMDKTNPKVAKACDFIFSFRVTKEASRVSTFPARQESLSIARSETKRCLQRVSLYLP